MPLFVISSLALASILGLLIAIAGIALYVAMVIWVYRDARARTNNPIIWTLIVLLVPNYLGLIIYVLIGRRQGSMYL
ncbi:MAG: PLDc N-terminal domain-containing protein [Symbiobacteriaceae bacterium]|nr:PLDc N-terminal domain-containing protein [Symbiobacteriaceae bacterium]